MWLRAVRLSACRCARAGCAAQVAGYKVKVMLAEPKTRRGAAGGAAAFGLMAGKGGLPPSLLGGMGMAGQGYVGGAGSQLITTLNSAGLG